MKIIYVKWLDARGHGGPKALPQAKRMVGLVLESAGMLVSDDKLAVRIAQDIYADDEGDVARDIEVIPQRNVISKQVFTINGGDKKK